MFHFLQTAVKDGRLASRRAAQAWLVRLIALLLFGSLPLSSALAATFTFSGGSRPPCSGSWLQSGSTYTCDGSMTLAASDQILPGSAITIVANNTITLNGSNTVGSPGKPVSLQTSYGALSINGSGNSLTGNLKSDSGSISVHNTALVGSVTKTGGGGGVTFDGGSVSGIVYSAQDVSSSNGTQFGSAINAVGNVTLSGGSVAGNVNGKVITGSSGVVFAGNVSAQSGGVTLNGGSVAGSVYSDCCAIQLTNTNVGNGIRSDSNTITVDGGTIAGDIYTSGGSGITLNSVTMTSGSISTSGVAITINSSSIGSSGSRIDITNNNVITINGSVVYGNVSGGSWASAVTINSSSTVYGVCESNTTSNDNPGQFNNRCEGDGSGGGGFDHLRIEHAGSGVTCAPSSLTISACADAACSSLYTDGVSGTLTASGSSTVNWPSGSTFTLGNSGKTEVQVWVTTPGSVSWGATSVTPEPTEAVECIGGSLAAPCGFSAADAGFIFSVPDHRAGEEKKIEIAAVKKADNSLSCVPLFSDQPSKAISFSCAYANPASGFERVEVKPADGGGYSNLACGNGVNGAGTNVSLSFDQLNGKSSFMLRYADVGRVSLSATYSGTGDQAGLVLTHSDYFITAPLRFVLTASSDPLSAGSDFSATVRAISASGAAARNFGRETSAEGAVLTHDLIDPADGNDPTLAGTTSIGGALFSNGEATVNDVSWGEVGKINLALQLANAAGYLNSGMITDSNLLERVFRPHHLTTEVTPASGSFTYSDQPFALTVKARNAAGDTTQNYADNYARKVTLHDANRELNFSSRLDPGDAAKLGALRKRNSGECAASSSELLDALGEECFITASQFTAGSANINLSYVFADQASAPLEVRLGGMPPPDLASAKNGSHGSLPLLLRARDDDGVSSENHDEGLTAIRSGRLRLSNAVGSERLPLAVPAVVEYFDGRAWKVNTDDSSSIGWSVSALDEAPLPLHPATIDLSDGSKTKLQLAGSLVSGQTSLLFSPPGAGSSGYLDFIVVVPPHLQYPAGQNPQARISFGLYSGNKRIIYRREIY